jgi:hypothetical protein
VPHVGRVLFTLTVAGWVLLELSVRISETARGRGRTGHDRFTRVLIGLSIGLAIGVGLGLSHTHSLRLPAGVRWAGLLLIVLGIGLASGSWVALVICALVPVPATLLCIRVEEVELERRVVISGRSPFRRAVLPRKTAGFNQKSRFLSPIKPQQIPRICGFTSLGALNLPHGRRQSKY